MKRTILHASLCCLLLTGASCSSKSDPLIELRNNWYAYIKAELPEYRFSIFKSNEAFSIPVENNTDYVLDEVVVSVNYIGQAGGVRNTEQVKICNIPPHSVKMASAPDSPRGMSIDLEILNIMSKGMKFIYPGSSTNARDPYFFN